MLAWMSFSINKIWGITYCISLCGETREYFQKLQLDKWQLGKFERIPSVSVRQLFLKRSAGCKLSHTHKNTQTHGYTHAHTTLLSYAHIYTRAAKSRLHNNRTPKANWRPAQPVSETHTHTQKMTRQEHIEHTHTHTQINIQYSLRNLAVKVTAVSWVNVNTGPAEEMSFQITHCVSVCACVCLCVSVCC